ncbi:hypothetical protein CC99x_010435 [Candidatus Berkiella cookevillensis]|uniref:Uncharacterized protein n=1 Tax=Candidatus Berkiella cookevillensis TaxID=437022 RepID=A0A0Q9YEL1_9GAMM|nr:hypothetical protein [Candidatus Berkiella cookevillensis]MCS5709322.1 hypothetical protein [Candidatus Berkiella cookevillensis]
MLKAPKQATQQTVIIEELNDEENGVLVPVQPSSVLEVASTDNEILDVVASPSVNQFDCVIEHATVMKVAGVAATTVGPVVGGFIGNAMGYELGEKVGNAVKETVKESGDQIVQQILEETGMNGIPGAELLIRANVTGLAHEAGEMAYQETVKVMTTKGAAVGGLVAGGGTIVALESLNLFGYLYNEYVSPTITNFWDSRREAKLKALAEKMDAEQKAIEELESMDNWVMLEGNVDASDMTVEEGKRNTL